MPTLVVYLSHRGWPEPRLQPLEPLEASSQGRKSTAPSQGGKSYTPHQSSKPASTSGGGIPATLGGPVDPPLGRGGAGDSTWADWYQMTMRRAEGGISEPQGPPYPIGMVQVRREAIGQIYDWVNGKEPPSCNIASEALRAYYTRVDPQTLKHLGMPDTLHDL